MTDEEQAVINAAIKVVSFSKTNEWPIEFSDKFFEFSGLLNNLNNKINKLYPSFERNFLFGIKHND